MAQDTDLTLDPCRAALGGGLYESLIALAGPEAVSSLTPQAVAQMLEKPPESKMGDFALPCFRFAKILRRNPKEIAGELAQQLDSSACDGWLDRAETVGAFLNLFVDKAKMTGTVLPEVLDGRWFSRLRDNTERAATKVMIEYSQPNTHKEFHVGHTRNVILGQSLVEIYRQCGYPVIAANYYGDEGTHIATVIWHLLAVEPEPPTENKGEWLGQMYVESKQRLAEASEEEAERMKREISQVHHQIEAKQGEAYDMWLKTRRWSLKDFQKIYDWLHVNFDIDFYESELTEESQRLVDEYRDKGVFIEDQGAIGVDLKPYKLGFAILRKRDGNTLYATKDLALARRKFEDYDIDKSIYVVADEQNHHFRQVFKILELMGFEQAHDCHHLSYGMVVLPEGKMSSRRGTTVTLNDLRVMIEERIGDILKKYEGEWSAEEIQQTTHRLSEGALKYGMLATDPVREIVFNLDDWLSFEGNTGPYLMYSYTRIRSILRKGKEEGLSPALDNPACLEHPAEHDLIRYIYDFDGVVLAAAANFRPSQLATHLYSMCKSFNRFYTEVSVLQAETDELKQARLALVDGFSKTLYEGLRLLGITPPERM